MTFTLRRLAAMVLLLAIVSPSVVAQTQRIYSQAELDQMLAPVALYPDALLSQVLMAATYPIEVVEAARWSRANPGLQGDDAVRAVQSGDWDPSVQSLVAFPQVLAQMDENLDWMRRLGEAFIAQEPQVMDTVQQLRRRAQAAGNLQSNELMQVQQQGEIIVMQPISLQSVYVPYYDPLVVYGTWWWPAFQPVAWAPWPGYVRPLHRGGPVGFWWGRPVGLSPGFFFGNFDWRHRQVRVVQPSTYYYRPPLAANGTVILTPQQWQHEWRRREGFPQPRVQLRPQGQTPVRRQEGPVAPERQDRRVEQERPQSRPQPNAPSSIQLPAQVQRPITGVPMRPAQPSMQFQSGTQGQRAYTGVPPAQPPAQVQRTYVPPAQPPAPAPAQPRREFTNGSFGMPKPQEVRTAPVPLPQQRARTPEAPSRTPPEVRPQSRPQPLVHEEPRMREAQAPQQPSAEPRRGGRSDR